MQTIKRQANIIVYDVGSTYTKAVAFALNEDRLDFLGRAQSPTTLDGIMQGVGKATDRVTAQGIEITEDVKYYATCSAAGGLRMVAMGFMPRVTAKAAKEVAMSAGARVLEVISHEDSPTFRLEILRESSRISCCWPAEPTVVKPNQPLKMLDLLSKLNLIV